MAFVEKEGKGSLWNNRYKAETKHPDYTGTFTLNGVQYKLAGWKANTQENNIGYISLTVSVKEEQPQQGQPPAQAQPQTAQPPAQPQAAQPVPAQRPGRAQPPQGQPTEKVRILEAYGVLVREAMESKTVPFNEAAAIGLRNSRGFQSWDAVKACDNIGTLKELVADLEQLKAGTQGDGIPF